MDVIVAIYGIKTSGLTYFWNPWNQEKIKTLLMAVFSKTSTHICLLFPLKFFSAFIYSFWLPWVSFAAGLCLVGGESRVYSLCCACSSLQGLVLLQSMALGTPAQSLARGLSCSTACGIFLDQDWNLCPLHYLEWILNHWTTKGNPSFYLL